MEVIIEEAYQGLEEQSEMIINEDSKPECGLLYRVRTLHDTGQSNAKPDLQIINGKT